MLRRILIGLAAALCVAAPALAETLPVRGVYPAGSDAAAEVGVIAVEPFGGLDGQGLAIALSDRLRGVTIDGQPWFRVVPNRSDIAVDGVIQGTASSETSRRDAEPKERDVCVERDDDDKCIKRETQKIPCWELLVRLNPRIRLVSYDGALIEAIDGPRERAVRWCRDEQRPSEEELVRQMTDEIALDARYRLAPVQRLDDVRVMEKRDGFKGADRDAFREAIRLTKQDAGLSCDAFAGLEAANPANPSLLFNLGLCAESRGELDLADQYYRRALAADAKTDYAGQGLRRLDERRRANAQLDAHYGA